MSVAHVPDQIKLIDTNPDLKKNVLWSTRLSSQQLRLNLLTQNTIWYVFNFIIITTLTVVSNYKPDIRIPTFWPFTSQTFSFEENKVFSVLNIVAPIILSMGLLSLLLLWFTELRHQDREVVKKGTTELLRTGKTDETDAEIKKQDSQNDKSDGSTKPAPLIAGWIHEKTDDDQWHRKEVNYCRY